MKSIGYTASDISQSTERQVFDHYILGGKKKIKKKKEKIKINQATVTI